MSTNKNTPDTYIDPFTGEEKRVEEWSEVDAPPLNSPDWTSHGEEGLDLPDDPDERRAPKSSAWLKRQQLLRRIFWYAGLALLILFINFWVFQNAIFRFFSGN